MKLTQQSKIISVGALGAVALPAVLSRLAEQLILPSIQRGMGGWV
jgi:hypothetical protein